MATPNSIIPQNPNSLQSFSYALDLECPVPWPSSQEVAICQDYPFSFRPKEESPDEFVMRRYLETLWLPESIMPLRHFVQSLRRFVGSPTQAHPLHEALKPLLLSVRGTQDKYNLKLPRILQDEGGAGELEEMMMWFAWSKEKFEENGEIESGDDNGKEGEERWRTGWMERLERREVQIQIILYFQLLSLPPPPPTTPVARPRKQRKPKKFYGPPTPMKAIFPPTSSIEAAVLASAPSTPAKYIAYTSVGESLSMDDQLEYFMDKLSLWQLVSSLNPSGLSQSSSSQFDTKSERDWMQMFCEDVIEPLFKNVLPEQCALLRTKVFAHSPFSDDSDDTSSPPPDLRVAGKNRGKRPAPPLRLEDIDKSHPPSRRADSLEPSAPDRHRSRSRSVSVSVEEVRARGASRGGVASSKSLFKGEVEMKRTSSRGSRVLKPPETSVSQKTNTGTMTRPENSHMNTFPSECQPSGSRSRSNSQSQEPKTLAVDTPIRKKHKVEEGNNPDVVMDSPDILLLTGKGQWNPDDDEGPPAMFAADTPIKKRARR